VGDKVYAVGAPYGLELSLSEGLVSQLRGGPPPLIQTTAAISVGSSGGGLFNELGELVGLTTFYLKGAQGLNFALPVEWLSDLAKGKRRKPPALAAPQPSPGPSAPGYWLDRAEALSKARDLPGLLDHVHRWVQAEPNNPDAWAWIQVTFLISRGKPDVWREVLRLKPNAAWAWFGLGDTYDQLGRYREAISAYMEALRLKPDYVDAWNNLALAYALSGNRTAALQALKELRRYDPEKADKLFDLIMGR